MAKNLNVEIEALAMASPIAFTVTAGSAPNGQANVQKLIDYLCEEGNDTVTRGLWLDQIPPIARVSLVAVLKAMKTAIT